MGISNLRAWLYAMLLAAFSGLFVGLAAGILYGVAVFAGLLSIVIAVQFDPDK
jgi:hypothetical protein